jgi:hypothetical protein
MDGVVIFYRPSYPEYYSPHASETCSLDTRAGCRKREQKLPVYTHAMVGDYTPVGHVADGDGSPPRERDG